MSSPKTYRLVGSDGVVVQSTSPGALGGHRWTRVYGRLDCPGALQWIAKGHYVRHRVFFADEETAVAAGDRPCAVCLPGEYRRWTRAEGFVGARLASPSACAQKEMHRAGDVFVRLPD